jgi:hypothetical protein
MLVRWGLSGYVSLPSLMLSFSQYCCFQGGLITYAPSDAISQALSDFNFYNTDKKAQVVAGYVQTGLDTVNPILKLVANLL